jgi:DNA-binding NarL/FixJ family response regulator
MTMRALRILIADDHPAVRRALRSLLESETEWRVCGEASDGVEAVEMANRLTPDVVLLDVTMPRMGGLEATRRIRHDLPAARVVVLTTHALDVVDEESRRAGAHVTLSKDNAERTLIEAIETVRPRRAPVHLANSVVLGRGHVGAFFHSEAERYHVLASFIGEGLQRDEKAVHLIDPPGRRVHLQHLRDEGVDVDQAEQRGQLELISWDETYLAGGRFDKDAMLARIRGFVDGGAAEGHPRTRILAHMEWALQQRPGVADLGEYETRLNDVLDDDDDIVICAYDVTKFSSGVIGDVMRAHPAVIVDGSLHDNSEYARPG